MIYCPVSLYVDLLILKLVHQELIVLEGYTYKLLDFEALAVGEGYRKKHLCLFDDICFCSSRVNTPVLLLQPLLQHVRQSLCLSAQVCPTQRLCCPMF